MTMHKAAAQELVLATRRAELLRFNFDENSKGDSDVRVLDTRLVRAAKRHMGACFPCLGDIEQDELHRVERGLMDGKVGNARTCQACCLAMLDQNDSVLEARYRLGLERSEERRKGKK